MTAIKPQSVAGQACAEYGLVLLDGPDGVAVAMTPAAAEETARQLMAAAKQAAAQTPAEDAG